jgi:hypothetical protein
MKLISRCHRPKTLTLMLLRYEHNPMKPARSKARKLHLDAADDAGAEEEDFVDVAMAGEYSKRGITQTEREEEEENPNEMYFRRAGNGQNSLW